MEYDCRKLSFGFLFNNVDIWVDESNLELTNEYQNINKKIPDDLNIKYEDAFMHRKELTKYMQNQIDNLTDFISMEDMLKHSRIDYE